MLFYCIVVGQASLDSTIICWNSWKDIDGLFFVDDGEKYVSISTI